MDSVGTGAARRWLGAGTALATLFAIGGLAASVEKPPPRARGPVTRWALRHDLSPALRSMRPIPPRLREEEEENAVRPLPGRAGRAGAMPGGIDPLLQTTRLLGAPAMPPPTVGFEGLDNPNGRVPPDTVADVGPRHIVQWVNLSFAIWDKQGNRLYGPADGNTLWSGFGGRCESSNSGDPVVLYDPLADRWLMSQLAFSWPTDFHQCIAISQTGDPTGAWYRYDFPFSPTTLNDYPKFGVWPDAYYLAVNQYTEPGDVYAGQGAIAFERAAMLSGLPARMISFDLFAVDPKFGGALPADLDGPLPPPPGSPGYFVEMDDDAWGWPADQLQLWRFHVDWTDPSSSTYGIAGRPDAILDLTRLGASFDSNLCNYATACLPQPGGTRVAALSDRLMYRLAYRNFGDHDSLVVNHSVDVDGSDHAGIRWYEVRDPGGAPAVLQAGTFAPDADNRWMASAAMDGAGDLAIGYSVSSTATSPSIRYAGRKAGDPPGTLPLSEAELIGGSGYQTGASRWGDYSALSVDPADDCTFWYTQEYYADVSPFGWRTRIGAFKIDGCGSCPILGRPVLSVVREPQGIQLSWTAAVDGARYDVVEGSLSMLRSTGGDFSRATTGCPASGLGGTSLGIEEPDPAPGDGSWYLVRGLLNGCRGTYDEPGASQTGSRDPGIGASPLACP